MGNAYVKNGRYVKPGDPMNGTLMVNGMPGGSRPAPISQQVKDDVAAMRAGMARAGRGIKKVGKAVGNVIGNAAETVLKPFDRYGTKVTVVNKPKPKK